MPARVSAAAYGPFVPRRAPQQLGDILQRLAVISPDDVRDLERIARVVLTHAERRYKQRFKLKDGLAR